jgi:opacity protein-like surface antigen
MIRKRAWLTGAALSGTLAVTTFGSSALAADVVEPGCTPAVSAFNGKLEGGAGYADSDSEDGEFSWEAGGSLSFPLGCLLGIQLDAGASERFNDTQIGGVVHLFTRDPESYLLGVTGGAFDGENATLYAVGPEAELYLGNFSLEAWGGYLNVDPDNDGSEDTGFIIADGAFYLTDDFRVSIGGKIIDDYEAVRGGFEYQFSESPLSLYAEAEYGDDETFEVLGGLKFYFGGEDKSLIRRHREDDPRNRSLRVFDLFLAGIDDGGYGDGSDGGADGDTTPR